MIFVKIVWLALSIVMKLESLSKFIWRARHGYSY